MTPKPLPSHPTKATFPLLRNNNCMFDKAVLDEPISSCDEPGAYQFNPP